MLKYYELLLPQMPILILKKLCNGFHRRDAPCIMGEKMLYEQHQNGEV